VLFAVCCSLFYNKITKYFLAMFNLLHTFEPSSVLIDWGPITVHWYGFLMALAMLSGVAVATRLAKAAHWRADLIVDLAFWLIIGGLAGARLYYIGLEWPHFSRHWLDMPKIWQGGLAIHGAVLGGGLALWLFAKKRRLDFWLLAAVVTPALALGQAIGRWGNYFNQELFGPPTSLPWGIPIAAANRPAAYVNLTYFHPMFLYESLVTFILFFLFYAAARQIIRQGENGSAARPGILLGYLMFYSALRLVLEEWRTDPALMIGDWRWPQIMSAALALVCFVVLIYDAAKHRREAKNRPITLR